MSSEMLLSIGQSLPLLDTVANSPNQRGSRTPDTERGAAKMAVLKRRLIDDARSRDNNPAARPASSKQGGGRRSVLSASSRKRVNPHQQRLKTALPSRLNPRVSTDDRILLRPDTGAVAASRRHYQADVAGLWL
jgi:hypothetical protein